MIYGLAAVGGGRAAGARASTPRGERREIKSRLGVVPQETNLDGELTVRENLIVQAPLLRHRLPRRAGERADELLEFTLLRDRAGESIWALSGGMKRRLLVARALVNEPELVVLDEPTTGLDPQARLAVWRALDRLRREGVTLLLTTHYMEEAARLCDRLLIMDHGGSSPRASRGGSSRARRPRGPRAELGEGCDGEALVASLDGRLDGHELSDGRADAVTPTTPRSSCARSTTSASRPTPRCPPGDARGRLPAAHRQEPGGVGDGRFDEPALCGPRRPASVRGDLVPSPRHAVGIWLSQRPRLLEAVEGARCCRPVPRPALLPAWRSASGSAPTSRSVNGIPYKDFVAPGLIASAAMWSAVVRVAPTTSTCG